MNNNIEIERKTSFCGSSFVIINFAIALIISCCVSCLWSERSMASQESILPGKSNNFSSTLEFKMAAEVLAQLRARSQEKGDVKLSRMLARVRLAIPLKSLVEESPNAYALPPDPKTQTNWVFIEHAWIRQVAGFADLAALYAFSEYGNDLSSFADVTFQKFCQTYKVNYRDAITKGQRAPVIYQFRFDDYFKRSDPDLAVSFVLFDKLRGIAFANTITWVVLHEVGHHMLNHTLTAATSPGTKRQREYKADDWAFQQMKTLGYSLFGIGSYLVARTKTDACLSELGLVSKETSHPSWLNRNTELRKHFDVLVAPNQDLRIFFVPTGVPEPISTIFSIFDPSSRNFQVTILQRGNMGLGMAEWNGNQVTIYAREAYGGRIECKIEDVTRVLSVIQQNIYDQNNRLIRSNKLEAIQQDLISLDFLKVGDMKYSDLRKRMSGDNLFRIHLRRAGASESSIHEAIEAKKEHSQQQYLVGLAFTKGIISSETMSEQFQKIASSSEQRLITIIGEQRYRTFIKSYENEINQQALPSLSGWDKWEEQMLEENIKNK